MLKEKMQMIKTKCQGKPDKKKIESLIVLIIILIVTLIAINTIFSGDSNKKNNKSEEESLSYKKLAEYVSDDNSNTEDELEIKLEEILSKMEGVGKVSVMITYSKGSEIVPMQNESSKTSSTQETDSDGGTRIVEENDKTSEIIYSGGTEIETKTIINPIVRGAIVIAEGASNATVKSNIVSAVEAITGLATYKVQVFEMNQDVQR